VKANRITTRSSSKSRQNRETSVSTSNLYLLSTSNLYLLPTSNLYLLPTSNLYLPSSSNSESLPPRTSNTYSESGKLKDSWTASRRCKTERLAIVRPRPCKRRSPRQPITTRDVQLTAGACGRQPRYRSLQVYYASLSQGNLQGTDLFLLDSIWLTQRAKT